MPRRRAPSLPVPSAEEAQRFIEKVLADAQRRSPTSARRPAEDAMKPIDYGRMNKGIV